MSLFTPELLQSFDQLRAYFAGTKEVAEIQSLAQHQSFTYYEGIWWMAASEVFAELQARIAPLIKQLIVPLLNKVGASNLAIRCEVVADHLNANVKAICAVAKFGAKYIAPIRDIHQITTSDFYLQSPIPVSSLSDERVAKLAHAKKPMINFYHRYGSCRGIANWFLAAEEATYLAKLCKKVYMIVRKGEMRASKAMQHRVLNTPNIEVIYNTETKEILGDKGVTGALLVNNKGEERQLTITGFFVAIGHTPNTQIFNGWLDMDETG